MHDLPPSRTGQLIQNLNTIMSGPPKPWWRRLAGWMFPDHLVYRHPAVLPDTFVHEVISTVDVHLDWKDRFKVLVSARVRVRLETRLTMRAEQTVAHSSATVLPPKWLE